MVGACIRHLLKYLPIFTDGSKVEDLMLNFKQGGTIYMYSFTI